MLDALHLVGKAAGAGEPDLVLRLVRAVASAALRLPENGRGEGVFAHDLGNIVHDAVLIKKLLRLESARAHLVAETEGDAGIDDRLTLHGLNIILRRNVDVGKNVQVGQPARERAGPFAAVRRLDGELLSLFPLDLAALKMQRIPVPVAPDGHVHVARGVLRGAGAETVETERILVALAGIVVVLAAGVQLAVDKLPVHAVFPGVEVHRAAAPLILDLNTVVKIARDGDELAVSLARFVDGVGEDLKHRVFAALQPVRAENDSRALAHTLRPRERGDALIAVILFSCLCHSLLHAVFTNGSFRSSSARRTSAMRSPDASAAEDHGFFSSQRRGLPRCCLPFDEKSKSTKFCILYTFFTTITSV